MSNELIHEIERENLETFEEFTRFLLTNRIDFVNENKNIFKIVVKEILYKDELRKMVVPYFEEIVPPLLNNFIDRYKSRGEIIDLENKYLISLFLTPLSGFFISRFCIVEEYEITAEEIDNMVHLIVNGLANHKEKK